MNLTKTYGVARIAQAFAYRVRWGRGVSSNAPDAYMCAKKTLWSALKKRCFFLKKPVAACISPVKGVYGGFNAVLRGGGISWLAHPPTILLAA